MISRGEKIGNGIIIFLILLLSISCLLPFINQLAVSLSGQKAILSNKVSLWPVDFHLKAYSSVLNNRNFFRSLGVTVYITIIGTIINLFLTIITAYPLTKKYLKGRRIMMSMIVFTMLFNGGMIPTYLLVDSIGINNTLWALMLPIAISTFNLIILKTFFQNIPVELEESATIDGCGHIKILLYIYLPLSGTVLATLGLFYAVAHWNSYMDAIIYLSDVKKYTLQVTLRQLIMLPDAAANMSEFNAEEANNLVVESLKAAIVIVSTLPILLVYPWLQKYFVKGVMIGAVKG